MLSLIECHLRSNNLSDVLGIRSTTDLHLLPDCRITDIFLPALSRTWWHGGHIRVDFMLNDGLAGIATAYQWYVAKIWIVNPIRIDNWITVEIYLRTLLSQYTVIMLLIACIWSARRRLLQPMIPWRGVSVSLSVHQTFVCSSHACTLPKQLNGSRSCLTWRLLGPTERCVR